MRTNVQIVVFIFVFFFVLHKISNRPVGHAAGVLVTEEPIQVLYGKEPVHPTKVGDAVLDPLASYHIRARLISSEPYWLDHGSKIAPIDFCVGWGRLSDSSILNKISFSQSSRFCYYSWSRQAPLPEPELLSHVANMHLIPADHLVEKILKRARIGQIVTLDGDLVRALYSDGGKWTSSLSRTDTGDGACELMLVKSVLVEN